ncbi:MAG: hypothetical protein AAF959_01020 [Cyanobacteria bacterium P01_D01_bin.56]
MPAHRSGPETQQDPIRLRNLIGQAATRLVQANMDTDAINRLLAPASDLLEQQDFWQHQRDGLVLFLGEGFFQHHRVPLEFDEFVGVSQAFYVKPLLPLLTNNGTYYVLAASQNQVRVFQATRSSIEALQIEDVPTSLAEALKYDDPEKQLQFHSGQSSGAPVYHGQGKASHKTDILRFFQAVDRGLQSALDNTYTPMIFVGVDYLFPIYQEANSYPTLLEESVQTNPDVMHPDDIHGQTWPIAQAYFEQASRRSVRRYRELMGSTHVADRLTDILNAAHDGQVETLFVASGHYRWGVYDAELRRFTESDRSDLHSDSLLNLAAVYTLNCGGQVFVMDVEEMPSNTVAAAILRYPIPQQLVSAV